MERKTTSSNLASVILEYWLEKFEDNKEVIFSRKSQNTTETLKIEQHEPH